VHFLNIKHIKNPLLAPPTPEGGARMVEVVFPGKEFMIEKYNINGKWLMINGKLLMVRSALPLGSAKNGKIRISWRFLYGYRWYVGLKGFWLVITRKTEEKKTSPHPSRPLPN